MYIVPLKLAGPNVPESVPPGTSAVELMVALGMSVQGPEVLMAHWNLKLSPSGLSGREPSKWSLWVEPRGTLKVQYQARAELLPNGSSRRVSVAWTGCSSGAWVST